MQSCATDSTRNKQRKLYLMTKQNRNRKQNRDRIKSNLSEFELLYKLLVIEKDLNDYIERFNHALTYELTKESDKQLFGRGLEKVEYAKLRADEAYLFLEKHGFLYLSTIDRLAEAADDFQRYYDEFIRRRSLEILIERGEEIDFEIPSDLKLEEI